MGTGLCCSPIPGWIWIRTSEKSAPLAHPRSLRSSAFATEWVFPRCPPRTGALPHPAADPARTQAPRGPPAGLGAAASPGARERARALPIPAITEQPSLLHLQVAVLLVCATMPSVAVVAKAMRSRSAGPAAATHSYVLGGGHVSQRTLAFLRIAIGSQA